MGPSSVHEGVASQHHNTRPHSQHLSLPLLFFFSGSPVRLNPRKGQSRALDRIRGRAIGSLDSASPKFQPTRRHVVARLFLRLFLLNLEGNPNHHEHRWAVRIRWHQYHIFISRPNATPMRPRPPETGRAADHRGRVGREASRAHQVPTLYHNAHALPCSLWYFGFGSIGHPEKIFLELDPCHLFPNFPKFPPAQQIWAANIPPRRTRLWAGPRQTGSDSGR